MGRIRRPESGVGQRDFQFLADGTIGLAHRLHIRARPELELFGNCRYDAIRAGTGHVAFDVVGSLLVGGVLGIVLGFYISRVGRLVPLTVLLLALASVELGRGLQIEHLLVCMAAGFAARNLYPTAAGHFLDALEQSSTPIYVVFFALVGAGLDLGTFAPVWLPAAVYVLVRLTAI